MTDHAIQATDSEAHAVAAASDAAPLVPLTFLEVLGSALAALIGVQSRAHKVRDFTRGTAVQFIAAGVLFTAAFVFGVIALVRLALP